MEIDWFGRLIFAIAAGVSTVGLFAALDGGRWPRSATVCATLTAVFMLLAALGRIPW